MSRWWGAVLATAMLALASPAAAEPGLLEGTECRLLPAAMPSCAPGSPCSADGTAGSCIFVEMTPFCVPDGAVLCCGGDHDCPGDASGGPGACMSIGSQSICLDPGGDYCAPGVPPGATRVLACHRDAFGMIVPWRRGDCDLDGIPNGEEVALGTDHCLAPARMAVFDPLSGNCLELPVACNPSRECTTPFGELGDCLADGAGTTCFPRGSRLYCGDGEWVCPDGEREIPDDAARHDFCVPPICGSDPAESSIECVHHPVTREPVPPPQGDCDVDGVANEVDPDPCDDEIADAGTSGPDAGDPPPADGGNVPRDAGTPNGDAALPPMDGGDASEDAGANIPPAFGGGGGCACRAGAAARGTAPLGLLALALGLSLRGARRARPTPRGGAGRRCPR